MVPNILLLAPLRFRTHFMVVKAVAAISQPSPSSSDGGILPALDFSSSLSLVTVTFFTNSFGQNDAFLQAFSSRTILTISPLILLSRSANVFVSTRTNPPRFSQIVERNRASSSTSRALPSGNSTLYRLLPAACLMRARYCPSLSAAGGSSVSSTVACSFRRGGGML